MQRHDGKMCCRGFDSHLLNNMINEKFNPKKHSGTITCRRLNITTCIDSCAIPHEKARWLCKCGNWTKLDPYYHDVFYEGVKE